MRRDRAFMAGFMVLAVGILAPAVTSAAPVPYPDRYDGYGRSSSEVDVGLFYDDLDPYGQWVEQDDYGWVFAPRVSRGWRPYTVGHWVWTDEYGWLWVSDETFGWATYHYGRWLPDPRYGWVWVPGYEWGPAWVSWRSGGGYIGWAPLPPRVRWQVGIGFNIGGSRIDTYIAPERYNFVEERAFVEPRVYRRLLPSSRAAAVIHRTENVTNYRPEGRRVINRSVNLERIERVAGHRVPRLRPVEVDSVNVAHRARIKGDTVAVFRPEVRTRPDRMPPRAHNRQNQRLEQNEKRRDQQITQQRERQQRENDQRLTRQREREQREVEQRLTRQRQTEERQQITRQRERQQQDADRRLQRERQQQDQQRRALERRQQREAQVEARQRAEETRQRVEQNRAERRAEQQRRAENQAQRENQKKEERKKDSKDNKDKPRNQSDHR